MNDPSNILQAAREPGVSDRASPPAGAAQPLQRVGALVEVPFVLRKMNVEPGPLFAALGLDPAALCDIDGRLPFPVVCDLLLKCVEATGRADFPLVLGACARLDHLGVVGKLLGSAPDFGSALLDFVANHPRYVRGASIYLIDWKDDEFLIGHRVHHPGLRGSALFSAAATAFGRPVFAELCGVEPTRALLSLPRPNDPTPYKRAFGRAKVVFEAEHFGLVFPRAARMKAIPGADPERRREIRKFIADRWNVLQPDALDRVMRVLVPSVLAGTPSLKATAELLVTHPRALDRALKARGVSFRQAVNEARFEMASQLLRDTGMSVGGVAQVLGYSEVSAFTRFFTSMSGHSPSAWKRRELL
ncbi:helix-turn-helix domain-containing protein [Methylocella sp.]|uniref:helix-turn-helix domain-containing protein n=1 Tax=Methylocella sp. TaxID=1978226 RepID=UPI0037844572